MRHHPSRHRLARLAGIAGALWLTAAVASGSEPQLYQSAGGAPRGVEAPGDSANVQTAGYAAEPEGGFAVDAEAAGGALPELPPRSDAPDRPHRSSLLGPASSMVTSLALVLAVFGLIVWAFRRTGGSRASGLPNDMFQVIGRGNLAPRHQAALVRCGQRVLLVGLSPSGARTLAEFTDPDEVARLSGACAKGDARESFHDALRALGKRPASEGFVESAAAPASLFSRGS